jgi:ABC-2 type transport system permease protein
MTWLGFTTAQFLLSMRVYRKGIGIALTGTLVPLGLGIFVPLQSAGTGARISGVPASLFVLTGFLAFATFFTVYNVVSAVTARRDALIYKRLRTSPLPDTSIFAGEGAAAAVPSLAVAALLVVFGMVVLRSGPPANILLLVLGLGLGSVMFVSLAVGVSGILPGSGTAMWVVTPVMVFFMICSGIFTPLSALPGPLPQIAAYLPMSPLVGILRTAYLGGDFASHDAALSVVAPGAPVSLVGGFGACLGAICILIAWSTVGIALARKLFRWDPKRAG